MAVESIVAAAIAGVLASNSRNRAVMEYKLDQLTQKVEKHNHLVEKTYRMEQDLAVAQHDIETLYKRTEDK